MFRRLFRFSLFASALAIGAAIGCAVFNRVEGSGTAATDDREIGKDVTEVVLSGVGDLTVVKSDTPALRVTADDNLLPLIETVTSGNKLTIRTKSGHSLAPKTPITYTLFVPNLTKLDVSGAGNAIAEGLTGDDVSIKVSGAGNITIQKAECKNFTVTLSGAGNATLSGSTTKLTVKVSGAGDVKAADLKAAAADVQISGAGDATIWATDELKARVSGAGDVKYKGSPRVEQKVSGAGSISAMN